MATSTHQRDSGATWAQTEQPKGVGAQWRLRPDGTKLVRGEHRRRQSTRQQTPGPPGPTGPTARGVPSCSGLPWRRPLTAPSSSPRAARRVPRLAARLHLHVVDSGATWTPRGTLQSWHSLGVVSGRYQARGCGRHVRERRSSTPGTSTRQGTPGRPGPRLVPRNSGCRWRRQRMERSWSLRPARS